MAATRIDSLRVKPSTANPLARRKSDDMLGWTKEAAKAMLLGVKEQLSELQTRLFAEGSQALLVVLQAMDAGGKDGLIRDVFTSLNPAGVRVTSFKVPAGREARQDYLWRCHAAAPAKGEIGLWNRSHYEDVLVVRVKDLLPEGRWRRRYGHIRDFEGMLIDEGTTIVKFFLHISREEQRLRLQDRADSPDERWKFSMSDLPERERWDQYMAAFRDALAETSTDSAPWYVIPSDHKWVRNLAAATVLRDTLRRMDPQYPPAPDGVAGLVVV